MWIENLKKIFKKKRKINTKLFIEFDEFFLKNNHYFSNEEHKNLNNFIAYLYMCRNHEIELIKDNKIINNSLIYKLYINDILIQKEVSLYFSISIKDKQEVFYACLDLILNLIPYQETEIFRIRLLCLLSNLGGYIRQKDYDNLHSFALFLVDNNIAIIKKIIKKNYDPSSEYFVNTTELPYMLDFNNKEYFYIFLYE